MIQTLNVDDLPHKQYVVSSPNECKKVSMYENLKLDICGLKGNVINLAY